MTPTRRIKDPIHPGEILLEEFLNPLHLTQAAFAKHIRVPFQRLNEIVRRKRGITADTAWRLSAALGTSPEYWVNLQAFYDLHSQKPPVAVKRLARAG